MHFISQLRYNAKTQDDEWYYRIKESYRDPSGHVKSRIMLNVGFIPEPHRPSDIRDIGYTTRRMTALTRTSSSESSPTG